MWTQGSNFLFLFLNVYTEDPEKIANVLPTERVGIIISAIKFEAVQLYLLSDIFVAVAIVVA